MKKKIPLQYYHLEETPVPTLGFFMQSFYFEYLIMIEVCNLNPDLSLNTIINISQYLMCKSNFDDYILFHSTNTWFILIHKFCIILNVHQRS